MAIKDGGTPHQAQEGDFFLSHRQLAAQLCAAFSHGSLDAASRLTLNTLFPGCCLMSMHLPVAAPRKGLLSAGNMATDERPVRSLTPLGAAAAGMALCERRWFHVARSAAPGLCKYKDLSEAFGKHGCEAMVFVPILPELPSWARPPAGGSDSIGAPPLLVLPALGVLTLGIGASTIVDARLLTSLFLLAHLVANQLLERGANVLLNMRQLSLSESSQHQSSQHESSQPGLATCDDASRGKRDCPQQPCVVQARSGDLPSHASAFTC